MKFGKRIFAAVLILAFSVFMLASCESKEKKLYDEVYAYLEERYKGVEFEIKNYVQYAETSGKYFFQVTCTTTGVDFHVIKTTLFMSDSYYVVHANHRLQNEVFEVLGVARDLISVESVQCFDRYQRDSGTYRFSEDTEAFSKNLYDLKEIFRVNMKEMPSSNEAAQCIYMFCDILENAGISLERVNFQFVLNEETIRLETDTKTIDNLTSFESLEKILDQTKLPSSGTNIFYKESGSDIKVIPFPATYNQ